MGTDFLPQKNANGTKEFLTEENRVRRDTNIMGKRQRTAAVQDDKRMERTTTRFEDSCNSSLQKFRARHPPSQEGYGGTRSLAPPKRFSAGQALAFLWRVIFFL